VIWRFGLGLLLLTCKDRRASQQKVPDCLINGFALSLDARSNQERVDQLVSLEQTSRNIGVQDFRDAHNQNPESLLHIRCLCTLRNGLVEQCLHISQGVLIHWIYACQVSNDEIEDAASNGHGCVKVSSLVDGHLYHFGLVHSDVDLS